MYRKSCYLLYILFIVRQTVCQVDTCSANDISCHNPKAEASNQKLKRYLLYDVNPGEGFNLRRDVYMRIATLVKKLNEASEQHQWTLVLPPWGPLYHWKTKNLGPQDKLEWSKFFNLNILKKYVPVIELNEFIKDHGPLINILYYLQHYAEGWTDGVWEERANIRDCIELPSYRKTSEGKFRGWFWGYKNILAENFYCLSVQGYSSTLKEFLFHSSARAIMIDRAEVILHDNFGDAEYWMVRRSMVFSDKLISYGNNFRKLYLNSTDEEDKTELHFSSLNSPIKRNAIGGSYISVHLRRQDFVRARPKEVPSIKFAAKQIQIQMKKMKLVTVFIASDASNEEFDQLKKYIPGAQRFNPTKEILYDVLDGGVAIIDQWICAHARYFLGTYESTFSFRIQEEREILGFPVETTFNRLCGSNHTKCVQPAKWTIVF